MGHDHRSDSSSDGVVVAVVAVLILLGIGGFFAVGAGVWVFRANTFRQEALVRRDIAMANRQRALATERAASAAAEAAVEVTQATELARLLTIKIDRDGNVRIDDEQLALADLETSLRSLRTAEGSEVELLIQVDERCTAGRVLDVVRVCDDVGIDNFQLTSLVEPADAAN